MEIMSRNIPPGNRLHTDKALFGTDKGKHGPVKIILKDGKPPDFGGNWITAQQEADDLARQQELAEQDYTQGCPFE